jgi:diguanylate cyclase (GGDEF)-like protein
VLWPLIDDEVAAFSLVPIVIAAWLRGARAGVLAAIFFVPLNLSVFLYQGRPIGESIVACVIAGALFSLVAAGVGHMRDTSRRVTELTLFDETTGLASRAALRHAMKDAIAVTGASAVIALVKVSAFRDVNESFGYEIGDQVLRELGARLRASFEPTTVVARFDGAIFGILGGAGVSRSALAERSLAAFDAPVVVDGHELQLEGRVGLARFPDHGVDESTLLRRAEGALQDAERSATRWAAATKAGALDNVARLKLLAALRAGLRNGEFRVHYQPVLAIGNAAPTEFEALARWQRADGTLVLPSEFIPLAERSGLIIPLTDWVIDEACRQARDWENQGDTLGVAVNVSARSLVASARLPQRIEECLARHGVDAAQLTVEVTETDVMSDAEQTVHVLNAIKALGVRIAVDDFGTGYSSLSYLHRLPLDAVKIDRSFVQRLLRDANTATIVRAAIDLSHALGLDVVAEGVETAELVERLRAMGCDKVQGYHIAKPMPSADVPKWLQARHSEEETIVAGSQRRLATGAATGEGTVLIVDDEHPLRVAAHRILSADGFRVIHAATASEALRLCGEYGGQLDLVLSDVFLTDWRGFELADHLRKQYPTLKVMLMSGDPHARELTGDTPLLAKPFTKRDLIDGVRAVLAA